MAPSPSFVERLVQGTSSLLVFFLILSSTYVGDIFSCEYRRTLEKSPFLKQVILFFILYVFVVQLNAQKVSIYRSFLVTAFLYVWFFLMMRLPLEWTLFNIFCLFALYILQVLKDGVKEGTAAVNERKKKWLMRIQIALLFVSALTTVTGVLFLSHRRPAETQANWRTLFTGIPDRECYDVSFPHIDA